MVNSKHANDFFLDTPKNGRTKEMIFSIPELIEVISASTTLQPGDIIATGTPAGDLNFTLCSIKISRNKF